MGQKKKTKEDKELELCEKFLVGAVITKEYFYYLDQNAPDSKLIINNELISIKMAKKIFLSYANCDTSNEKAYLKFLKEVTAISSHDKEFDEYLTDRQDRCQECGFKPVQKRKMSIYHPEYDKTKVKGRYGLQHKVKCPICNDEYIEECGQDLNPKEGIK